MSQNPKDTADKLSNFNMKTIWLNFIENFYHEIGGNFPNNFSYRCPTMHTRGFQTKASF